MERDYRYNSEFYNKHKKMIKIMEFREKHPCWYGIITGAISGGLASLIVNIILLLARI